MTLWLWTVPPRRAAPPCSGGKRGEAEHAIGPAREDLINAVPPDAERPFVPLELVQRYLWRTGIPQPDPAVEAAGDEQVLPRAAPGHRAHPPLVRQDAEWPVATVAEPRDTSRLSTALPDEQSVATCTPTDASHSRTDPSHEAEYRSAAVLQHKEEITSECPPSCADASTSPGGAAVAAGKPLTPRARLVGGTIAAPDAASPACGRKSRSCLSQAPDAMASPAGLAATDSTAAVWPRHRSSRWPAVDQTLTVPSLQAPTGRAPSHATALTGDASSPEGARTADWVPVESHRYKLPS
eukprot:scaffold18731_cov96-Isochrysis_galbana.AAC.1